VEYAKQFIEDAKRAERCNWCLRAKSKNTLGLCRHCNEIKKRIARLELAIRKSKPNYMLDWELQVGKEEQADCKAWGAILTSIFAGVDSLDLEHWFSKLSDHIAGDTNMHSNSATMLGWTFDAAQHEALAYLFWEMFAEHASRHRKSRARSKALRRSTRG
jgi:hypothetical protein